MQPSRAHAAGETRFGGPLDSRALISVQLCVTAQAMRLMAVRAAQFRFGVGRRTVMEANGRCCVSQPFDKWAHLLSMATEPGKALDSKRSVSDDWTTVNITSECRVPDRAVIRG